MDIYLDDVEVSPDKLNKANTRAMIALQNENYEYFSDIIKVEVIDYIEKLDNFNESL